MNKLIIYPIIFLLLIVPVMAAEWDNAGWYDEDTKTITIRNLFILNKLAEYTLTSNTDTCIYDCKAEGTVTLYNKGKLFSNLIFEDKKGKETSIQDYSIYYYFNENYEIDVPDYKETCNDVWNDINETMDK
ncbi:unnamed protein product, partial [marine sediment metagenome]